MKPTAKTRTDYRLDIQGIRAICMIQVLLFHAWNIGSPIGVDSFIMISAYLMAGSFIRSVERGNTPSVRHRWVHTFKRLLPPLVVTVTLTALASLFILPSSRQPENLVQAIASLMYWENWRLMAIATDYYAGNHSLASPFQHLWSMSMQGQIFLLWPVIMALCAWIAQRTGWKVRPIAAGAFTLLTIIPLVWLTTASHDGGVYFDTRARIWEFAFGSTIAIISPFIHLGQRSARLLSWAGLITLVTYCLVPIGTYPGPMGFAPMGAVSAMLIAGRPQDPWNASHWLALPPLVALGNISYSVYLVHWPIFVLYLSAMGQERLTTNQGVAIILVSLGVALLLHYGVDRPMTRFAWPHTPMRKLLVVTVSLYIGLTPFLITLGVQQGLREESLKAASRVGLTDPEHPGAWVILSQTSSGTAKQLSDEQRYELWNAIREALPDNAEETHYAGSLFTVEARPTALVVNSQWAGLPEECSPEDSATFDQDNSTCRNNGEKDPDAPHAYIIGDSHAEQLLIPMVAPLAQDKGWKLTALLKGGCAYVEPDAVTDSCSERNAAAKHVIERDRPEYLFLIASAATPDSPDEYVRTGYTDVVEHALAHGVKVIGVRDNLRSESNLFDCSTPVDPNRPWSGCEYERKKHFAANAPGQNLAEKTPGYVYIDMTDAFCIKGVCPSHIGNVAVYLDHNHVTRDYAVSMAPFFAERFHSAWIFDQVTR